jgi:hypothetical protein
MLDNDLLIEISNKLDVIQSILNVIGSSVQILVMVLLLDLLIPVGRRIIRKFTGVNKDV